MNSINTTSVKDMIAGFPIEELPKIVGKPTLGKLMQAIKHLIKCARSFDDTDLGTLGMIFLCMSPQQYDTYSPNRPYVAPLPPGPNPIYPANIDENQRETIRLNWLTQKKEYERLRPCRRPQVLSEVWISK